MLYKKIENKTILNIELDEYDRLTIDHKNMLEYIANGNQVRSRIQSIEKNEKSTKYYFNREKHEYDKKTPNELQNEEGRIIKDEIEIRTIIETFYSNLYRTKHVTNQDFTQLDTIDGLHNLTNDQKDFCEKSMNEHEVFKTLKLFDSNKSPGIDGLSKEFYEVFWPKLKDKLLLVYNQSLIKGYMTNSQRQAIVSILHKKGKDPTLMKSYRPISLLCFDYKLYTKTLSQRLVNILPNIINEDQFGFIKGRYIGSCVRFTQDIIDYTDIKNIPGIILQLYFEKAFDTIHRMGIYLKNTSKI